MVTFGHQRRCGLRGMWVRRRHCSYPTTHATTNGHSLQFMTPTQNTLFQIVFITCAISVNIYLLFDINIITNTFPFTSRHYAGGSDKKSCSSINGNTRAPEEVWFEGHVGASSALFLPNNTRYNQQHNHFNL